MAVDYIADRCLCDCPYRTLQRPSLSGIAAAVDDRHAAPANDETDVGYGALVVFVRQLMPAEMHINSGCDFDDAQALRFRSSKPGKGQTAL